MATSRTTPQTTPLARAVGQNVRRARLDRSLSVVDLAARSGIARATLTQLEGGRGNPTIDTIEALAAVLGCAPESLLRSESVPRVVVVRDGEGSPTSEIATLVDRRPGSRTEVFDFRLGPGGRERSTSHGPGSSEIVLMRDGRLRVGPADATVELAPGDYATFSGDCLHEYEAAGGAGARFWLIVRYGAPRSRRRL